MGEIRINCTFSDGDMGRLMGLSQSSGNRPRDVIKDALNVTADYEKTTQQEYVLRAVSPLLYTNPSRIYLDRVVEVYTPYNGPACELSGRFSLELSDVLQSAVNDVAKLTESFSREGAVRHSLRILEALAQLKSDGIVFDYVDTREIRDTLWIILPIYPHAMVVDNQGVRLS